MAVAHVAGQDCSVEGSSFVTSIATGAMPAASTAGNCIAVSVSWYNATGSDVTSITDDAGNTYVQLGTTAVGASVSIAIYLAKNIVSSATPTITAHANAGGTFMSIEASEYSGQNTTTQAGGTNKATGTTGTTTPSAGNVTPASGDLALAAVAHDLANSPTITAGTGWTLRGNIRGVSGVCLGSEDQAGTGSAVTGTFTMGASVTNWAAVAAVIQAAAAGGGSAQPSMMLLGIGA